MSTKHDAIPLGLTYDDVLLVPRKTAVNSRQEISLRTKFSRHLSLNLPIVSANQDTVTESTMAIAMAREGGLGIIHRFMTIVQQATRTASTPEAAATALAPAGAPPA